MMAETLRNYHDRIVKGIPTGRIGSPEDIIGACLYLSSRAGQYVVGAVIVVDGGTMQSTSQM
jgi:NAD(P)-dependent dehydrogenase (short-subunit alcohol dehydrogenase family)